MKKVFKRALATLLVAVMLLGVAPVGAIAASEASNVKFSWNVISETSDEVEFMLSLVEGAFSNFDIQLVVPDGYEIISIDKTRAFKDIVRESESDAGSENPERGVAGVALIPACFVQTSLYIFEIQKIVNQPIDINDFCIGFKACGDENGRAVVPTIIINGKVHNHIFDDKWEVTKEPTTTTVGRKVRYCTICGTAEFKTIDKLSGTVITGKCGDNLTWELDPNTGKLTISGRGDMYDYTSNNRPWEDYIDNIKSINIGDEVTSIGNYAFYNCINLTNVYIGQKVTRIGKCAFAGCVKLANVNFPKGIKRIEDNAFENTIITDVVLPDGLEHLGYNTFKDCEKLTSVVIPDGVTEIDEFAFYNCTSIRILKIGKSVKRIGNWAFKGCTNLEIIYMPESVEIIGDYAFENCPSITDVYYAGSKSQWSAIDVGLYNDDLLNATIHFAKEDGEEHVHSWGKWTITKYPTDTEQGERYRYCLTCGVKQTEILDEMPTCDHEHTTKIIVPSTCKVRGMEYEICDNCGATLSAKTLDYADHKYVEISREESTCIKKGCIHKVCSTCGKTLVEELPLAEHKLKYGEIEESTCTKHGLKYDICTVCGKKFNITELPLAEHTWSEWKVIKEPTTREEGLKEHFCTVCSKNETETVEKLKAIIDKSTGIEVGYNDEFDDGTEIKVEQQFDGSSFQLVNKNFGETKTKIYDITTYKNGKKVQPKGEITVMIPLPDGFNPQNVFVTYVNSDNGYVTKIPCEVKDGYVVFKTNHFSQYAIVEMCGGVKSVSIGNVTMNYKDSKTLSPIITADDGAEYTITYSSDSKNVTVDENGKIYGAKKGTANITVTVTDSNGNTVSDTCKVTVEYSFWQWIIKIVLFGWIWY